MIQISGQLKSFNCYVLSMQRTLVSPNSFYFMSRIAVVVRSDLLSVVDCRKGTIKDLF